MIEQVNKMVHFPDLSFFQYCQQIYGINRGVYNTIDDHFFSHGLSDILQRRPKILAFLSYLEASNGRGENGRLKIGRKGLTMRLQEFSESGQYEEKKRG
ncbi:hypothetical protein [Halalkalibacter oceani]|uniref:hypothetical protein n=1 Tax=Halalkalibacter oceani TaxID=1653776 RepID=UPI00339B1FD0